MMRIEELLNCMNSKGSERQRLSLPETPEKKGVKLELDDNYAAIHFYIMIQVEQVKPNLTPLFDPLFFSAFL